MPAIEEPAFETIVLCADDPAACRPPFENLARMFHLQHSPHRTNHLSATMPKARSVGWYAQYYSHVWRGKEIVSTGRVNTPQTVFSLTLIRKLSDPVTLIENFES